MSGISVTPYALTTGNSGLFNVSSTGGRQGTAYPDPVTRYALRGCNLAASETLPMWGGVGVYMDVPGGTGNPSYSLGPTVGRAVSLTDASKPLAGFSTFDQAYGMMTDPQNPVPTIFPPGQVMVYPLGCRARFWVQCDPSLVDLIGDPISTQVSWDFTNQLLIPYLGTLTISSYAYNSTTGIVTLTMSAAVTFDAGDSINVASLNITGLNGTFTALTTSGVTVTYQAATGLSGSPSGGGTMTVGGGSDQALPIKVLDVMNSGCEVVQYNAASNQATWNYNGAAAVIQL